MNKVQKEFVETVLIMWEAARSAKLCADMFRMRLIKGTPLNFSSKTHDRSNLSDLRESLSVAIKRCDDLFGRRGPSPKEIRKDTIYDVEDVMLNDAYSLLSVPKDHVDNNQSSIITKLGDLLDLTSIDKTQYYRSDDIDDIENMVLHGRFILAKKRALHLLRAHDVRKAGNHNG